MTAVTYTAKRSIATGHTTGVSYDLDLPLSKISRKPKVSKKEFVALSGESETLFNNVVMFIDLATSDIEEEGQELYLEFLDSVIGGEVFLFDERGTAATPVNPIQVKIEGGYSEQMVGATINYKYIFKIKIL